MGTDKNLGSKAKLPVRQLAILAACRFAEPLAFTSVFPYLPEMIESFGIDKLNVAKWAGMTSAAFSFAQCITAIAWGRASDRYGRKPMVVLALFSTMVTSLMWGFSLSLPWAIIARAASGACNGNVGIMRTMVAEMVPEKELQPRAFSILPLIWAVGSTVGPAFGGYFAKPAENFPGLFGNNKLLIKFPFALPNLMAGAFFIIGLTFAIFFLKVSSGGKSFPKHTSKSIVGLPATNTERYKETLETKKNRPDYGLILGEKLTTCFQTKPKKSRRLSTIDDESTAALLTPVSPINTRSSADMDEEWTPEYVKSSKPALPPPSLREIFTSQTSLNLITYCFLALHSVSFDQLLPVFLHHPIQHPTPENTHLPFKFSGGFGLDSGRIGTLFTLFGIIGGLIQFLIFPPVARRYGVLNCYKACTLTFPVVYFLAPFPALLAGNPLLQQSAILGIMVIKSFCVVFGFPCVMILLTNSAPSLRVLGTLNGFATSFSAIGRAVGPALSGVLFTWGVANDYVIAPWWTLALIATLGIYPVWQIKEMDGFSNRDESEEGNDYEELDNEEEARLPSIEEEDYPVVASDREVHLGLGIVEPTNSGQEESRQRGSQI